MDQSEKELRAGRRGVNGAWGVRKPRTAAENHREVSPGVIIDRSYIDVDHRKVSQPGFWRMRGGELAQPSPVSQPAETDKVTSRPPENLAS
jgi:hypothetical protein